MNYAIFDMDDTLYNEREYVLSGFREVSNYISNETKIDYYEIPKKILYSAEPFSLENGLLTQTLKLKRARILEKFGAALEKLYEA